jgi:hypothetical protein
MQVLHIGLGFHLKVPKPPMNSFEMTLHMGIVFRVRSLFKGIQTT